MMQRSETKTEEAPVRLKAGCETRKRDLQKVRAAIWGHPI